MCFVKTICQPLEDFQQCQTKTKTTEFALYFCTINSKSIRGNLEEQLRE